MNAKEMFKELGYKRDLLNQFGLHDMKNIIKYKKEENTVTYIIMFDFKSKEYATMFSNMYVYGQRLFVDKNLHQAIHQQLLELGWLDV